MPFRSRSVYFPVKYAVPRRVSHSFGAIPSVGAGYKSSFLRGISSNTLPASVSRDSAPPANSDDLDLKRRLFSLVYPRRSATTVLRDWAGEGRKVAIYDLRHIAKRLARRGRYKHTLEVMKWMEGQEEQFEMSSSDHALRLESTVEAGTLTEAEDYFANLPTAASKGASYLPLLNAYVKERDTEKAESLMAAMTGLGANLTPHPFNAMMKLYVATSRLELVPLVVSRMKRNGVPRNVLSYNLWMAACGADAAHGAERAENVYGEMARDARVRIGWSSLCTLAHVYAKRGLVEEASRALGDAEKTLSPDKRLGHLFLVTNYASLGDRDGVLRAWASCKRVKGRLACAEYMCILKSLVGIGGVGDAEKVFSEWESRRRRYDVRVSNVLLGAYARNGWMERAESLHTRTLERGACPNRKTWEILVEGYARNRDVRGWRPSPTILASIFDHFEKCGGLEEARRFLEVVRGFGLGTLPVYQSMIRMHVAQREPVTDLLDQMKADRVDMDGETMALVQAS